jgi:hypothetical protein
MRVRPSVFALVALLGWPAAGHAGPIDFSYSASGVVTPPPDGLYPGAVTFLLDGGGNVNCPPGGGTIELGAVNFGAAPGPQDADSYTAFTTFRVSVVVSDQHTGESATLDLNGDAVDMWDYRSWDGRWTNSFHKLEFGDSVEAVVGLARYTLSVRAENHGQTGVYSLSVVSTAPEPATLALAAIALAPLGLRRLCRKVN